MPELRIVYPVMQYRYVPIIHLAFYRDHIHRCRFTVHFKYHPPIEYGSFSFYMIISRPNILSVLFFDHSPSPSLLQVYGATGRLRSGRLTPSFNKLCVYTYNTSDGLSWMIPATGNAMRTFHEERSLNMKMYGFSRSQSNSLCEQEFQENPLLHPELLLLFPLRLLSTQTIRRCQYQRCSIPRGKGCGVLLSS